VLDQENREATADLRSARAELATAVSRAEAAEEELERWTNGARWPMVERDAVYERMSVAERRVVELEQELASANEHYEFSVQQEAELHRQLLSRPSGFTLPDDAVEQLTDEIEENLALDDGDIEIIKAAFAKVSHSWGSVPATAPAERLSDELNEYLQSREVYNARPDGPTYLLSQLLSAADGLAEAVDDLLADLRPAPAGASPDRTRNLIEGFSGASPDTPEEPSWLAAEAKRAKERSEQLPPHGRPVVTRPTEEPS
jgi:hypothetical protein